MRVGACRGPRRAVPHTVEGAVEREVLIRGLHCVHDARGAEYEGGEGEDKDELLVAVPLVAELDDAVDMEDAWRARCQEKAGRWMGSEEGAEGATHGGRGGRGQHGGCPD